MTDFINEQNKLFDISGLERIIDDRFVGDIQECTCCFCGWSYVMARSFRRDCICSWISAASHLYWLPPITTRSFYRFADFVQHDFVDSKGRDDK